MLKSDYPYIIDNNKSNTSKIVLIFEFEKNKVLSLYCKINNKLSLTHKVDLEEAGYEMVVHSFLHASHDIFYNHLPCDSLNVIISDTVLNCGIQAALLHAKYICQMILTTNKLMSSIDINKLSSNTRKHTLVYSPDDSSLLKTLYKQAIKNQSPTYIYQSFDLGFDSILRKWGPPKNIMSPEQMINYIHQFNIGRIISLNTYYIGLMSKYHQVFMLAVLKYVGVALTTIDQDAYGISPSAQLAKAAYNNNEDLRFSTQPGLEYHWDQLLNVSNIQYYISHASPKINATFEPLNEDYAILVAAHSRMENLLKPNFLKKVLAAFEFTREKTFFFDFQFWCHVMLYFTIHKLEINMIGKLYIQRLILSIHFSGISLLKYEVLHSISNTRKVLLYGDIYWDKLFPQYYRGKSLNPNDIKDMLCTRQYLYLHVNNKSSQLDTHPVVLTSFQTSTPFLGFPAVKNSPGLEGLKLLEYQNITQMNHSIENINSLVIEEPFKEAAKLYADIVGRSACNFQQSVLNGDTREGNIFFQYFLRENSEFESLANRYIAENLEGIKNYLSNNVFGKDEWDMQKSKLYNRPYIQAIIRQAD